jgi:glutaredoxin
MTAAPVVTVYGKSGCHLCEEALEWLRGLVQEGRRLELVEVDVSRDTGLDRDYGTRIPVVSVDGIEASELDLDREAVLTRLDRVTA